MNKVIVFVMMGVLCGLFILPFNAIAENKGAIRLIPSVKVGKQGQEFEVDIWVEGVDNLYGLQIHLKYDPTQLEVMDFLPDFFGWEEGTYYVLKAEPDHGAGTFDVGFTCLGKRVPFTGIGKVGTIVFNIKGTDETLNIGANTGKFGGRACIGVDDKIEPTEYAVHGVTIRNDNTPPAISTVKAVDNCTVQITFSEPIEKTSAEDVNNYWITPDLAIKDVQLDSQGNMVTLTTEPQVGNRCYEVNVINIMDMVGNKPSEGQRKSFRGAMRLWLEAVDPIYNRNEGVLELKVGPVEQLYSLMFYIQYDENHFEYIGADGGKGGFKADIEKRSDFSAFGGTLSTYNAISFEQDCTICEFYFMPHGVISTPIEFLTDYPVASLVAIGIVEDDIQEIVTDVSHGVVNILKSYQLTGYIQLAEAGNFGGIKAFILGEEMVPINVKSDGSFQLDYLIPRLYTVRLSKPGYLIMDYPIEVLDDIIEKFKMIAGDLTGDGIVDILDIAAICQKFSLTREMDGWDPVMDYNNDGWIDIIDVSIMAINYNERSNVQ